MRERLQKYLAACGVASRRESEKYILAGRIRVNGSIVRELGTTIDVRGDAVSFDGRPIKPRGRKTYIMLNKPGGCVTTSSDQFNRTTVMDYVRGVDARLVSVGRLDYNTTGLLLLTDDGELVNRLTHPRYNVEKTYVARIKGIPDENTLQMLRGGIVIEGKKTAPASVRVTEAGLDYSILAIRIHEGRNRQVRKMLEAAGHRVVKLQRTAIGELSLGGLKPGEFRFLTPAETDYLGRIGRA